MSKRRVVVTGMGIISPVGNDLTSAWANVVAAKSGIGPIPHLQATELAVKFGGPIRDFDPASYISPKDVRKMDPFIHYGIAAATQAIKDSGIEITDANRNRIGVAVGAGIGGIHGIEATCETYFKQGPKRISPFFVPSTIINMAAGHISIMFGLRGPNIAVVTA